MNVGFTGQRPTVGRIVHWTGPGGTECHAAIVTRVPSEPIPTPDSAKDLTMPVDIQIFKPSTSPPAMSGIEGHPDTWGWDGHGKVGTWHWPTECPFDR